MSLPPSGGVGQKNEAIQDSVTGRPSSPKQSAVGLLGCGLNDGGRLFFAHKPLTYDNHLWYNMHQLATIG